MAKAVVTVEEVDSVGAAELAVSRVVAVTEVEAVEAAPVMLAVAAQGLAAAVAVMFLHWRCFDGQPQLPALAVATPAMERSAVRRLGERATVAPLLADAVLSHLPLLLHLRSVLRPPQTDDWERVSRRTPSASSS